jgi:hypothetical protein
MVNHQDTFLSLYDEEVRERLFGEILTEAPALMKIF